MNQPRTDGHVVSPTPCHPAQHGRGAHLVLTGFMGAGKSTVGRLLAARRGHVFLDLDAALEARTGRTIAEIFTTDGETGFRDLETALLIQFADQLADAPPHVIATGGGVLEREVNRAMLERLGLCAWLAAPWPTLHGRIAADADITRPLAAAGIDEDNADPSHLSPDSALEHRWRRRLPSYATADFAVSADQAAAEVADALDAGQAEVAAQVRVTVPLGDREYEVWVGEGALARGALQVAALAPPRALVVVDAQVAPHWLPPLRAALDRAGVRHDVHVLPVGEAHKTLRTVEGIWDHLLDDGADRGVVVIALGGGVTGDMAGFAAATALRGVRVVQLPTTVLAMVDASVGGKTGINYAQGKNLVGAFHQPTWVGCDLATLSTLPPRDRVAGLAEVVKVALTLDAELLRWLERDAAALRAGDLNTLRPIVARAIALKASVVARDEREGGLRRVLNFGHTVGHAIEHATDFVTFRHGEAVALGMVAALAASVTAGCCTTADAARAIALLAALGLPTELPANIDRDAVRAGLRHDKKRDANGVRFILCAGPGRYAERWLALDAIPLES